MNQLACFWLGSGHTDWLCWQTRSLIHPLLLAVTALRRAWAQSLGKQRPMSSGQGIQDERHIGFAQQHVSCILETLPHMPDPSAKRSILRGQHKTTEEVSLQIADGTFGRALSNHFRVSAGSVKPVLWSSTP